MITTEQYRKWQLSSAHTFIQKLHLEQLLKKLVAMQVPKL